MKVTRPGRIKPVLLQALAYTLLILGSFIFVWPLIWMIGTSVKMDKELFKETLQLYPERPLPARRSPYIEARVFDIPKDKRFVALVQALEAQLLKTPGAWSEGLDHVFLSRQVARGLALRMRNLLSAQSWELSPELVAAEALKKLEPAMVTDMAHQLKRSLLIGQLRARSYDLQEDMLVSRDGGAVAWQLSGTAKASLQTVTERGLKSAELHYEFQPGDRLRLSQTFTLSFPIERLHRLQLSVRSDEGWHPLKAYVEKQGQLFEAVKTASMADNSWAVHTWQEPGPEDLTNKIRTWTHLKSIGSGESFESGKNKIKVTFEFGDVNAGSAWLHKIKRNYKMVFDNMPFWRYAATSGFLVLLNLFGTLLSCSMVAYSFARLRWPGRSLSYAVMLGTMMIPSQVTMIPFFLIIKWLGWYNTLTPLWFGSFFASAFNVFLLHQFFKGIPTDLEDAAKIDGCGPLRIYWYIMLPLIKPALATIAIFTFMGVWNDFMGPLIYLNDQRLYPLSLGLYALNVQAGGSMSMMMGGSLLMLLPVVVIFFFAQRYFIEGITMTGMKG